MASIDPYLKVAVDRHARKLILKPERRPVIELESGGEEIGKIIKAAQIKGALLEILSDGQKKELEKNGKILFQYSTWDLTFNVLGHLVGDGAEVAFAHVARNDALTDGVAPSQKQPQRKADAQATSIELKNKVDAFLAKMIQYRASDLHLCSDCRPIYRVDGDLKEPGGGQLFTTGDLEGILFELLREEEKQTFQESGSCDFAYEIEGLARFRFNVFREHRGISAAIRVIPSEVLSADQLNLPEAVRRLAELPKGMVLVTGPTGSGKSTTLAAVIDLVNQTRADHILTIEAPIEFLHRNRRCLVHQREVGRHTTGFKNALRDALREDPDVVLVGEMRDLETISTALETANTGHLVFGTLHTTTATSTINRIIDIYPTEEQTQIRYMLAESLKAVVAQTLLKKKGGGRIAALEVLIITPSVANLIREQKTHQILNMMQTGKSIGMQLLTEELVRLVAQDLVQPQEAYMKAVDKAEILRQFSAAGISFEPPNEHVSG